MQLQRSGGRGSAAGCENGFLLGGAATVAAGTVNREAMIVEIMHNDKIRYIPVVSLYSNFNTYDLFCLLLCFII